MCAGQERGKKVKFDKKSLETSIKMNWSFMSMEKQLLTADLRQSVLKQKQELDQEQSGCLEYLQLQGSGSDVHASLVNQRESRLIKVTAGVF